MPPKPSRTPRDYELVGEVAARLKISSVALRTMCREGLAHRRDAKGRYLVREDLARKYLTQNKPELSAGIDGHGGKRGGAGRPAKRGKHGKAANSAKKDNTTADLPITTVEDTDEYVERVDDDVGETSGLSLLDDRSLDIALKQTPKDGGLSIAGARRRMEVLKAASAEMEIRSKRGELLSTRDVESAWREALMGLATHTRSAARDVMVRLMALLTLPDNLRESAEKIVNAAFDQVVAQMAEDPTASLHTKKHPQG